MNQASPATGYPGLPAGSQTGQQGYQPGRTGYEPGRTGYNPPNTPAYQMPGGRYQSMPAGSNIDPGYRPGGTGTYGPSSQSTMPAGGIQPASGSTGSSSRTVPASYELGKPRS